MMLTKPMQVAIPPALLALASALAPCSPAGAADRPIITVQPPSQDVEVARYVVAPDAEPALPRDEVIKLLRQHVKYVFQRERIV